MAANRRIVLQGNEDLMYDEKIANAAITPGHLLNVRTDGKVEKHGTAGGTCELLFAEQDIMGNMTIDTAYEALDLVRMVRVKPGAKINALVAAAAPAIALEDILESAGDGTLRKVVGPLIDNSGGTADGTIAAVTGSYVEATMENNTADIAAAVNILKGNGRFKAKEAVDNSAGATAVRIAVICM